MFSGLNSRIFILLHGTKPRGILSFLDCVNWCSTSTRSSCDAPFSNSQERNLEKCTLSVENQNEINSIKRIPITAEDFKALKRMPPCQPENPHVLKVAILGEPNAGKSTLINSLVKWKVCAVSRKVHTTRKKSRAVMVEGNTQIIFVDTPGFVSPELTKRHSLEASFVMDPISSMREAELIAVVVDICNKWTNNRINENILEVLNDFKDKKTILILNKIDAMKSKSRILSLTRILTCGVVGGNALTFDESVKKSNPSLEEILKSMNYSEDSSEVDDNEVSTQKKDDLRGWKHFSEVFMVSGLTNYGVDKLREYLVNEAIPKEWVYHDSFVTDQNPRELALMIVRENLLEYLPQEIPYNLDLKVVSWEILASGCPKIDVRIKCINSRHRRFVIGPSGKHIAACVEKSRLAMREAFRKDVVLHIGVV